MRETTTVRTAFFGSAQLFVAVVMLVTLIPAGYMLWMPSIEKTQLRAELRLLSENRDLWSSSKPTEFEYVVIRGGSLKHQHVYFPYVATESRGFRTAVFKEPVSVEGIGILSAPHNPVWIDDIFELIESSIRSDAQSQVHYHPEFGFPTDFRVWWPCADCDNAVQIRDFRVLNGVQNDN